MKFNLKRNDLFLTLRDDLGKNNQEIIRKAVIHISNKHNKAEGVLDEEEIAHKLKIFVSKLKLKWKKHRRIRSIFENK